MWRPLWTCRAIYELARLAWITRFRFKGPYWTWRMETAFGAGPAPTLRHKIRAALSYAAWAHELRRRTR